MTKETTMETEIINLVKTGTQEEIIEYIKYLIQKRKLAKEETILELLVLLGKLPTEFPLPRHLLAIDLHRYADSKGLTLNREVE